MKKLKRDDLMWLAGLLEGEGCFTLSTRDCPRIQMVSTDMDVVRRVAKLFDRELCEKSRSAASWGKKKQYMTRIMGNESLEWMEILQPHMGKRRTKRIREVIRIAENRPRSRNANT